MYKRKPKILRVCRYRACGKEYLSQYPNSEYCCSNHRQRERWQRELDKKPIDRIKCLECNAWFVQLGSHVKMHGYESAREYKIEHRLDYGKGIVPEEYHKRKGDIALDNGTYKNLENGAKDRFTKGGRSIEEVKRYWAYKRTGKLKENQ